MWWYKGTAGAKSTGTCNRSRILFHNYTIFPSQEKCPRKMLIKYSFGYPPKERCRASWTSVVDIPAPARCPVTSGCRLATARSGIAQAPRRMHQHPSERAGTPSNAQAPRRTRRHPVERAGYPVNGPHTRPTRAHIKAPSLNRRPAVRILPPLFHNNNDSSSRSSSITTNNSVRVALSSYIAAHLFFCDDRLRAYHFLFSSSRY